MGLTKQLTCIHMILCWKDRNQFQSNPRFAEKAIRNGVRFGSLSSPTMRIYRYKYCPKLDIHLYSMTFQHKCKHIQACFWIPSSLSNIHHVHHVILPWIILETSTSKVHGSHTLMAVKKLTYKHHYLKHRHFFIVSRVIHTNWANYGSTFKLHDLNITIHVY